MPLSGLDVRRLRTLAIAEAATEPEWLLLKLGQRQVATFEVLRWEDGLLLAFQDGVITTDELEANAMAGVTSDIGPATAVEVPARNEEGDERVVSHDEHTKKDG